MNRHMRLCGMAFVVVLSLLPWAGGVAGAEGATVSSIENGCTLLDGNGSVVSGDFFGVMTNSEQSVSVAHCQGQVAPSTTGRAVTYENFGCIIGPQFTTDSRESFSASGHATLTCVF